ncbi:endonuclease [Shewanella corallii]|uniref:Endonuclease n=1 Tax=Shewanella corallii TaxID=560080 RepID=A0ABT0NAD7_9GAMM|nr:endonuclease [Shewanella corallii]MCL2915411.1 endonuclease [Shewanella corallii]
MKTHPTKIALALMALGGFSAQASANLVITEYVEGGGQNKAIEISNMGAVEVDLSAHEYKLVQYKNGATNSSYIQSLVGKLSPNESVVYRHKDAETEVGIASTIIDHNGNDAYILYKDDVVIDRFGVKGEDKTWTDAGTGFNSKDKTLRRKASVISGDTNPTAPFPSDAGEWEVFNKDTLDGLGCSGVEACAGSSEGVLLITEYIEGSGNNKVIEISNVGGADLDLDAHEYKLVLFSDTAEPEKPGNTEILSGTLKPNESLVFYNNTGDDEFKKTGISSNVTFFNGDDTLILYKDNVVIDRFGKLGEKITWTDDTTGFSSANKTLRRKENVTVGDTDAKAPFPGTDVQWAVFDINTADGIGCPGEGACDSTPPGPDPDPDVPCTNCENLEKVADATKYNFDLYYNDVLTADLNTPQEWKAALSAVALQGQKPLSYKGVWTVLTYSDEDPANPKNVIELYSGKSISKYDNGGNKGDWNREHVWPKSHGFPSESLWGYTDAHHLRPTDVSVNGARAAYDFDNIATLEGSTELTGAPGNYVNAGMSAFEPRDEVKGDVARMMFYMDTRYETGGNGNMPDLVLVDKIGTDADKHEAGKLCALYQWHLQDPVGDADRQRNDAVYEYQGNRNPYIDNPEWVQQVYGADCGPELDVTFMIEGPATVVEGVGFTLDAAKTTAANGKPLTFEWSHASGIELNMSQDGALLRAVSGPVAQNETVELELTVTDGELSATHLIEITIEDKPLDADIQFVGETSVDEGGVVSIEATPAQTGTGDAIQYTWTQVSGTAVEFKPNGALLDFTAPDVELDAELVFSLEAFDGRHHAHKTLTVTVKNQASAGWEEPEGGAMGALLTLLLPLAFWRRRKA